MSQDKSSCTCQLNSIALASVPCCKRELESTSHPHRKQGLSRVKKCKETTILQTETCFVKTRTEQKTRLLFPYFAKRVFFFAGHFLQTVLFMLLFTKCISFSAGSFQTRQTARSRDALQNKDSNPRWFSQCCRNEDLDCVLCCKTRIQIHGVSLQ